MKLGGIAIYSKGIAQIIYRVLISIHNYFKDRPSARARKKFSITELTRVLLDEFPKDFRLAVYSKKDNY